MLVTYDTEIEREREPYEAIARMGAGGASPRGSTYWRRAQLCPREHLLGNVLAWDPVVRADALDTGLLWHGVLEVYYRALQAQQKGERRPDTPEQEAFRFLQRFRDPAGWLEFYDCVSRMLDAYVNRWQNADREWEIVAVEFTCGWTAATHPEVFARLGFELTTRLDMLVVDHSLVPVTRIVEHKCLASATRIRDRRTGRTSTIAELAHAAVTPEVLTAPDATPCSFAPAAGPPWRQPGLAPVLQIATKRGRTIVVTPAHRMRTERGWVPAGALLPGDRLAVALDHSDFGVGEVDADPPELYRMLGYLLGDGTTSRASLCRKDRAVMADAARCSVIVDGYEPAIRERANGVLDLRFTKKGRFWARVREWDLDGCLAAEKFIPPDALDASHVNLRALLGALWATDGCIDMQEERRGARVYHKPRILYSTRSRALALDVHELLRRVGYDASLKTSSVLYEGERRSYWTVQVLGPSRLAFLEDVIDGRLPVLRTYAPEHLTAIRDVVRGRTGAEATRPRVVWDVVASVLDAGREVVWDLSVPGDQCFEANGFIVHNSSHALDPQTIVAYAMDDQILGQLYLGRYWLDWSALGYPPFVGSTVNVATKAKSPKCERLPIQPSDAALAAWAESKRYWQWQSEQYSALGYPRNYAQCTRRFGRCQFYELCRREPRMTGADALARQAANALPQNYVQRESRFDMLEAL